jgi:hypothetical protein
LTGANPLPYDLAKNGRRKLPVFYRERSLAVDAQIKNVPSDAKRITEQLGAESA